MAHRIYIEPLTLDVVSKILRIERPQGILPTLGGQTGLNLAMELADSGILNDLDIRLLGTCLESIKPRTGSSLRGPWRRLGKVPKTPSPTAWEATVALVTDLPSLYAPTLGGTGGGIAMTWMNLWI